MAGATPVLLRFDILRSSCKLLAKNTKWNHSVSNFQMISKGPTCKPAGHVRIVDMLTHRKWTGRPGFGLSQTGRSKCIISSLLLFSHFSVKQWNGRMPKVIKISQCIQPDAVHVLAVYVCALRWPTRDNNDSRNKQRWVYICGPKAEATKF